MEFLLPQGYYIQLAAGQVIPALLQAALIVLLIAATLGCAHSVGCQHSRWQKDRSNIDES
jgi:hypothetical protein